jgi:Tfp pilus assembly protein PilW
MSGWAKHQQGHSLAQSLLGLLLSMLVVMAAFASFGWVQSSHQQLHAQTDAQQRLKTILQLLRERVQRAGAPELLLVKGKARIDTLDNALSGTDDTLSLMHPRSITPADCQGHEASSSWWLLDDFQLSKQALQCKDSWRDDASLQALVDEVRAFNLRYAQALPGNPPLLQWRRAEEVSDWNAVRGVQVCIQAMVANGPPLAASAACSSNSSAATSDLAWRGVAVFRHHTP